MTIFRARKSNGERRDTATCWSMTAVKLQDPVTNEGLGGDRSSGSAAPLPGKVGVAGVQAAAQAGDLRPGEADEHLLFQRVHLVPVAVEQVPAGGGQRDDQAPAVGPVAVPFDQAASFQSRDHV